MRGVICVGKVTVMRRPGINKKRGSVIQLGEGVILCSNAAANPVAESGRCRLSTLSRGAHLVLGDRVGLSSALICSASRVEIGDDTIIGGGVMIFDTDFHYLNAEGLWGTDPKRVSRPIKVGKNCFIGARAILLKGTVLGDGVVVGAGAVVTGKYDSGSVVAGNPSEIVKYQ